MDFHSAVAAVLIHASGQETDMHHISITSRSDHAKKRAGSPALLDCPAGHSRSVI